METKGKCAHPACKCRVGKDEEYFSQYCRGAGGEVEISCDCKHPGCAITEGARP